MKDSHVFVWLMLFGSGHHIGGNNLTFEVLTV